MLIYKNHKYATTTDFQFECDRAVDCQITFKRPDSKRKFLELYNQREDKNHGDTATIDGRRSGILEDRDRLDVFGVNE